MVTPLSCLIRIVLLLLLEAVVSEQGTQQCEQDKLSCMESTLEPAANNMALVLYDENQLVLSTFYKPERKFTFLGHTLTISQNWSKGGVAAVVWDSAIVLSEYLSQHQDLVRGRRVLELGAGTGLVGMVAALAGGDVTSTEREEVLNYLQTAVASNLDWGAHKMTVTQLDWTHDHTDKTADFDLIVGADIIYIEDTFQDLLRTLRHFASKDTLVLISCKIRYKRDSKFLSMMEEHFQVKKVYFDVPRDIYIYSAQKMLDDSQK